MHKTNVDIAKIQLVDDAIALCKKFPNDAELGRELRIVLMEHANRRFFGTVRNTDKNTGK